MRAIQNKTVVNACKLIGSGLIAVIAASVLFPLLWIALLIVSSKRTGDSIGFFVNTVATSLSLITLVLIWIILASKLLRRSIRHWPRFLAIALSLCFLVATAGNVYYYYSKSLVAEQFRHFYVGPGRWEGTRSFSVQNYRFRDDLVIDFKTNGGYQNSSATYKFPRRTISRVEEVQWTPQNTAVLVKVRSLYHGSAEQPGEDQFLYDFETGAFYSTFSLTHAQFQQVIRQWADQRRQSVEGRP